MIHEWAGDKSEDGSTQRAASSASSVNFGKYMEKKPKFERDYGKAGKQQEGLMQELSSSIYKPP